MTDLVKVTDDGAVRVVQMDRPDKKNALTGEMYDAMADAIEGASAASPIRCVLLKGVPGAFTAGNDLQDFLKAAMGGGLAGPVIRFLHALAKAERPLVAAVSGVAVGVGTTLLFHCDHVVAATDARLSTPFVSLGLVPEAASSLLAPRLMGQRHAFRLLVMGEPLDAAAAQAAGLVDTVVAPAALDAAALAAAHKIAALPPEAVAISRRLMRPPAAEIIARMDEEGAEFRARLASPEARQAFEAFLTRKK